MGNANTVPVDFVRTMLDAAPRMGFARRTPTASGTVASIAQPHTAASLAESHPSPRGSLLPCRGAPPTMTRPTRTTDEAAAAMGCSAPTARRRVSLWAALTQHHGCRAAGDGCRCASGDETWPHTATGTTGPQGGRPGYAVDAAQLDAYVTATQALDALRAA